MTLTKEVQSQLFSPDTKQLICLPPRNTYPTLIAPVAGPVSTSLVTGTNGAPWTEDEHARFLLGLEMFPSGPWKSIASIVGSRTARQTMSHAQKYRQKIARRQRGARTAQADMQTMQQQQYSAAFEDAEQEHLQQRFAQQHIDTTASAPEPFQQHASAHATQHSNSPVATLMTESLSDMHLTSEQIDEILLSLFEDDDSNSLVITSDDMDALMSAHH